MLGKHGEQAIATDRFVDEVVKAADWASVWLVDERLTTFEAREELRHRGVSRKKGVELEDCVAAALILQRFFEEKGGKLVRRGVKGGGVTKTGGTGWESVGYRKWKQEIMKRVREEGG